MLPPDSERAERAKRWGKLAGVAKAFDAFRPASEVLVKVSAVPTIFPQFDFATRVGGLPIERFTLLHGESAGGKTYVSIGLMLSFLMRDHLVFFVDAERCYDEQTEVLTRRGFVRWPMVMEDDAIGCWDPDQQSLVYEKPFELTRQRYAGPMYRVDHGGVDLLVTPKHKMYVKGRFDRGRTKGQHETGWKDEWELVPADVLGDQSSVKYRKHAHRTMATEIRFDGTSPGVPEFPRHDDRRALLRLIGFFVGDGWVGKRRGRTNGICFGLTKPRKVAYLRELALELGWEVEEMSNRVYVVKSDGIGTLFRSQFYDSDDEKCIPEYLLDLNEDDASAVLDGLRASDGTSKRGAWEYFTTSEQVAQAVQRLVLHAGGSAHINRGKWDGNDRHSPMIRVMVLSRMTEPVINDGQRGKNTMVVEYDGEIFCAHTRTGIMVVRRGGKPVLSGNTTPTPWLRKAMGEYADHPYFRAVKPKDYESTRTQIRTFLNTVKNLRDEGKVPEDTTALVVVDSIRKLVPKDQFKQIMQLAKKADADEGARTRIAQIKAQMNAAWLDELVVLLDETRTAMVTIAREMVDPANTNPRAIRFKTNVKTAGGSALFYDASLDLRSSRTGQYGKNVKKRNGGESSFRAYGDVHRLSIMKSKVSGREEYRAECTFHVSNGALVPAGFDRWRDLLELARRLGVVEGTSRLEWRKHGWRGVDAAVVALSKDEALFRELEAETREAFKPRLEDARQVG